MTAPVLVTGGTGTLGRLVVPRLRDAGCDVRVLSRRPQTAAIGVEYVVGDLATDEGIDAAVAGVRTVVHCAGSAKGDDVKARSLVRAAARAGVTHLVYISVIGADRVPIVSRADRGMFGYIGAKRAAEELIAGSGVPFTTVRAAQFHDLILTVAEQMAKLPVLPVPGGIQAQPIDAPEVADRLAELALGRPAGLVEDLGGPRIYSMADLIRSYLKATGRHRPMMSLRLPGKAARAMREGANLAPERAVGRRTWEDFLAARLGASVRT